MDEGEDGISGTYVFSLNDYSIKRISDAVYDAFYIFDNTGLYAICEKDILKVDYKGNVIDEIVHYYK
ncbi:MAG: hypothetical protein IKR26_02805 [Lachnospiraceae bacterium]|nr:hypothetical protein [Lachnospiraceae bacterium]